MSRLKKGMKALNVLWEQHSPEILTGFGVAGWFGTTIWAVKVTPEFMEDIQEQQPQTFWEKVKIGAKHYVWPVVTGATSTFCLFKSLSTSKRKNAGLAALVTAYENELLESKDVVKEIVGEKKAQEIEDKLAENKVAQNSCVMDDQIPRLGKGNTLCLDLITGQLCYADIDYIKSKFIDLNDFLQDHETMNMLDYAYILGLNEPQLIGHQMGWRYRYRPTANGWVYDQNARIELSSTSCLNQNGIPVFCIGHRLPPVYGFDDERNFR